MKALLLAAGAIALIAVGILFVGGVSPAIVVAPEHVFTAGSLAITNTMFTSWCVVLLLCVIAFFTKRGLKLVPTGFSAYVEGAVVAFLGMAEQVAGPVNGRRFFPLAGTIFFFVLTSNYVGLLPMNNIIGKPEPGHGVKQVVFEQTTLPLVGTVAYIPFKPTTIDTGKGEHAILPAGFEAGHGTEAKPADGKVAPGKAGESAAPKATPAGRGALLQPAGEPAVSLVPAGAASTAVAAAEPKAKAPEGKTAEPPAGEHGQFSGALSPWFRSVNTDINAPLAIALFSFVFVEFWGLQSLGPGYLKKFFAVAAFKKGPLGLIDIFVGMLELVSELSRTVSFTFRLFGNVFAGEVLLLMMSFLVPFVLVDVFYGLELFVGLIQAFVFAMLTLVFATTAVSHHDGEEHAAAGEHAQEHHGA